MELQKERQNKMISYYNPSGQHVEPHGKRKGKKKKLKSYILWVKLTT
jgi:hypothetical protein